MGTSYRGSGTRATASLGRNDLVGLWTHLPTLGPNGSGCIITRLEDASVVNAQLGVTESPLSYSGWCRCVWCGEYKPQDEFVRNRRYPSGYCSRCKVCHAAYMRRRSAELKSGIWKPTGMRRNVPLATRIPTDVDIAWAAGFLEGEGHFRRSSSARNRHGTEEVSAGQVNPEPLYRLQEFFGGGINVKRRSKWGMNDILYWKVTGERARILMRAVESSMSTRRREQIRRALSR